MAADIALANNETTTTTSSTITNDTTNTKSQTHENSQTQQPHNAFTSTTSTATSTSTSTSTLPEFPPMNSSPWNLAGHWIGHYGDATSYTLLNITYEKDGQVLVATKLVDPKNVIPAGQVSFMVNLGGLQQENSEKEEQQQKAEGEPMSPAAQAANHLLTTLSPPKQHQTPLPPLPLSDESSRLWNQPSLQRFHAYGQVGSNNEPEEAEWVPGELFLIDSNHIGFVWKMDQVGVRHWVFLGRPPKELWDKVYREDHGKLIRGAGGWKGVNGEGGEGSVSSGSSVVEVQAEAYGMVAHMGDDDTRRI